MLDFHQGETCEGIIRHLEMREGVKRRDVQVRDIGNNTPPDARVEMTFRLGDQLYAIEHTGIEPFDGFMAHQNRARDLFKPLEAGVTAALMSTLLMPGVVIEMHMPIDAFTGRKIREVRALQAALIEHVKVTAPTLPVRRYADYRGTLVTTQPAGVPFQISLIRFDGLHNQPGRFQLKHLTGSGQPRAPRLQRTCDDKFPKLAKWKHSDNARTILVLEDNDVQLTNQSIFADTFLPIALARTDAPDETYMVSTCTSPWYAWPILVNGSSYFDLAEISHPIHFEIDATGQLIRPRA